MIQDTSREYKKVSRATVKKAIKEEGIFDGFSVGNRVNQLHFFSGWKLANPVVFHSLDEFEKYDNEVCYYTDSELGKVLYYQFLNK